LSSDVTCKRRVRETTRNSKKEIHDEWPGFDSSTTRELIVRPHHPIGENSSAKIAMTAHLKDRQAPLQLFDIVEITVSVHAEAKND
jgi:hypothetical protein